MLEKAFLTISNGVDDAKSYFILQLYVLLKVKIYQQELLCSGILMNKKDF